MAVGSRLKHVECVRRVDSKKNQEPNCRVVKPRCRPTCNKGPSVRAKGAYSRMEGSKNSMVTHHQHVGQTRSFERELNNPGMVGGNFQFFWTSYMDRLCTKKNGEYAPTLSQGMKGPSQVMKSNARRQHCQPSKGCPLQLAGVAVLVDAT